MKKIVCALILSITASFPTTIKPDECDCLMLIIGGVAAGCCVIVKCLDYHCYNPALLVPPVTHDDLRQLEQRLLRQAPPAAQSRLLPQAASSTQFGGSEEKQATSNPSTQTTAAATIVISQNRRPSLTRSTSPKASDTLRVSTPSGYIPLAGQ